jgi:Fe-S-cluster containining protein
MAIFNASTLHPAITEQVIKKYPWLNYLGRALLLADVITQKSIKKEEEQGRNIACHCGCNNCCINSDVPITSLELQGISWYISEVLRGERHINIRKQLEMFTAEKPCPFLFNKECGIYPLRPLICRQHYVFNERCQDSEDIIKTRPQDVLNMRQYFEKECLEIATIMLQGIGVGTKKECKKLARDGALVLYASNLMDMDLNLLTRTMDMFESRDAIG